MSISGRKGKKQEKEAKKWEKDVTKGKADWDSFLSLLRWYHEKNDDEKCRALVNECSIPNLSLALQSYHASLLGDKQRSIELLEGLNSKDNKEQAWICFIKGLCGEPESLKECLKLRPRHPWTEEIKLILGQELLEEGKADEALGHLISLESQRDPQIYLLIAKAYHQTENDLASLTYLEKAFSTGKGAIKTEAAQLMVRLARQREEWNRVAAALRVLLEAKDEKEALEIQRGLVEAYINGGNLQEAAQVLDGFSGHDEDLRLLLAEKWEKQGKLNEALDVLSKVGGARGKLNKSRILMTLGRFQEAIESLEEALQGETRYDALFLLAQIAWEEKDHPACLKALREMGEEKCKSMPKAALLRAQAAWELEDKEDGVRWALEALGLLPDDEKKEARSILKRMKQELHDSPQARQWLPLLEEATKEPPLLLRLKEGLLKSRQGLARRLEESLSPKGEISTEDLERIEEILISADVGLETTGKLIKTLERKVSRGEVRGRVGLMSALKEESLRLLSKAQGRLEPVDAPPWVIMVVGVNGTGKTTTIAKLARRFTQKGKEVLLAAGDTFRAAATEQLDIWASRVGASIIKQNPGSDPSGVVYDSLQAAKARGINVVIIDTAGRLHTKVNLMEELKKMVRVADREIPGAPHEVLLVLDATTGQNALSQAKLFSQAVPVTGIVLTKLDGTAKGGIIIAIAGELSIPIKLIGVGEGMNDLQDFNAEAFVEALFDTG